MDNPFAIDYVAPQPVDDAPEASAPKPKAKGPVYHTDLIQGSDEWLAQRCGPGASCGLKLAKKP